MRSNRPPVTTTPAQQKVQSRRLDRAGVWVLSLLVGMARAIPERLLFALADLVGQAVYLWCGPDFLNVRRNLRTAFRDAPDERIRELARAYWRHLARALAEACRLALWTRDDVQTRIELQDVALLESLKARKCGVIVASGHLGSWEVGPYAFALLGYPLKLLHDPGTVAPLFDFVNQERRRSGMEVLSKLTHPWALKHLLDRGAWLCIACDVRASRRGDQIPFFDVLCSSYLGAVSLQKVARCPIVVTSTARMPDGRHKLHVWKIIEYTEQPTLLRQPLRRTMREVHRALEEAIRAYPEQWFWHYDRWRSRPILDAASDDDVPPRVPDNRWLTVN